MRYTRFGLFAVAVLLSAAACSNDTTTTTTTTTEASQTTVASPTTVAPTTTVAALDVVEITSFDYGYRGVPPTVEAGSSLGLINESSEEYHTMLVIRLDSTDERTLADFAMLDVVDFIDAEGEARFGTTGLIIGAEFGEDAVVFSHRDRLVDPGRYLVLCFNGVGNDPAEAAAQMLLGRPLAADIEDVVPHYRVGEIAEFVIPG